MHRYVAVFVALMPDVIASGDPPTVDAIKKEAPAIPIVMPSTTVPQGARVASRHDIIMKLAARHRLPAVYAFPYMAREGGLMSYGPDVVDIHRRSAAYVDRILKGGGQTCGPADQEPDKIRIGGQPEDRRGARSCPHRSCFAPTRSSNKQARPSHSPSGGVADKAHGQTTRAAG